MVRSTEAVTALRAMIAEPAVFEEATVTRLALRATMPIGDKKRALHLYESFMTSYAILLLRDLWSADDWDHLLREANRVLDEIVVATRP